MENPITTPEDTIQSAITQLSEDKNIFDKCEIDSRFIERYTGKYRHIEGNTKVFDYWYTEFTKIKSQVDNFNSIIEKYKNAFQNQFQNCFSCTAKLRESIKLFNNYQVSQIRANIDLLSLKTSIMVLFKSTNGKNPEDNEDYNLFLKAIYDAQEKCNEEFKPNYYYFNSLFDDENIVSNLIQRDYPISIRL